MAAKGFVDAVWVGYPARFDKPGHPQDGCDLVPGETLVRDMPAGEAEESANWDVVDAKTAKKLAAETQTAASGGEG